MKASKEMGLGVVALVACFAPAALAQFAGPPPEPPRPARLAAPVDLTGTWVSVVTEDWEWRMVTPKKGDVESVPLNPEGRRVADQWEPSKDGLCEAYGVGGIIVAEATLSYLGFGITPPTAIFGRLKTGDDIKVNFELTVGTKAIAAATIDK